MTDQAKPASRPWRRFLRFSVRGLIIVVLAIGVWLGWTVRSARIQREAVAAVQKAGGTVRYDWEWRNGKLISQGKPSTPSFLVDFVGADYFGHVTDVKLSPNSNDAILVHVGRFYRLKRLDLRGAWLNRARARADRSQSSISDKGLANLRGLSELVSLSLTNTDVGDDGLEHLKRLTNLESLGLGNTRVTDAGLTHLEGLEKLVTLDLGCTQVTGTGLTQLKRLTKLSVIIFQGSQITDAGLEHLSNLTKLSYLDLAVTSVSDAGLAQLKPLTNLSTLHLERTQISAKGLAHVNALTSLTALHLRTTAVTDNGLAHLMELSGLKTPRHSRHVGLCGWSRRVRAQTSECAGSLLINAFSGNGSE
jgi:internalin A